MKHKTLRDQWKTLSAEREEMLTDMFVFAQFTIPRLFPERYFDYRYDVDMLPELYSNKAASNIIRLANTMVAALMPPNDVPFFEIKPAAFIPEEAKTELKNLLSDVERLALDKLQASNLRSVMFQALQHAIVMKDALIYQSSTTKFKSYHPAHFQIRRDGEGEIVEYWTVDFLMTDLLPENLSSLNGGKPLHHSRQNEALYTRIYRKGDDRKTWYVEREFRDKKYETDKTYTILPYYHFGWTPVAGEDYSRSLVEENFGTIRSLELVSKALAEGLAAGSEGRILLDPGSTTTEDDILNTMNWSIISARPGSIDTFQPNTVGTVGVAVEAKRMYEQELDEAFLATSAADLRGERVTAFQTNQVVNERANALSGTLATLEQDLQRIVQRTLDLLIRENELSEDFKALRDADGIEIFISSGIDALGRQADVIRINELMNVAYGTGDPELIKYINRPNVIRALARDSGLDMSHFTYTDEQVAEQQAAAAQAQTNQAIQQQAIQTGGAVVEQAARQG